MMKSEGVPTPSCVINKSRVNNVHRTALRERVHRLALIIHNTVNNIVNGVVLLLYGVYLLFSKPLSSLWQLLITTLMVGGSL